MNILKCDDQYQFQCLTQIFKMLRGYSPDIYQLKQNQNENITTSSLRYATNQPKSLRLPSYHANQTKRTFLTQAPDLWNRLPNELESDATQSIFKIKLGSDIITHYEDRTICTNPACLDHRYHV